MPLTLPSLYAFLHSLRHSDSENVNVASGLETKTTPVEWETTMEPLFNKSMSELREAFVRARFAEPTVFGRPDIEEWLEGQRKTRQPNLSLQGFGRYESLIVRHTPHPLTVEYLDRYAAPVRGHFHDWTQHLGDFQPIVLAVLTSGGALYPTSEGEVVTVIHNRGYKVSRAGIKMLENSSFLFTVFAQWSRRGRKSNAARAFCCDALARGIAETRASAEADFSEAVAVSADGTRIVKVDEVIVILDAHHAVVYPASAFANDKILRNASLTRLDLHESAHGKAARLLDEFVIHLMDPGTTLARIFNERGQYLDEFKCLDKRLRLITQARFCPSPLPDGGREIRI